MDLFCYLCLSLPYCLACFYYLLALWSPVGKGLTTWILCVMFSCVFVTFPYGVLGRVRY